MNIYKIGDCLESQTLGSKFCIENIEEESNEKIYTLLNLDVYETVTVSEDEMKQFNMKAYKENIEESRDFYGVVLEYSNKNGDAFKLNENVDEEKVLYPNSFIRLPLNESYEDTYISDINVVNEKYGKGVSLNIGSVNYKVVSEKESSEDLACRLKGMINEQDSEYVINYLNATTFRYGYKNI